MFTEMRVGQRRTLLTNGNRLMQADTRSQELYEYHSEDWLTRTLYYSDGRSPSHLWSLLIPLPSRTSHRLPGLQKLLPILVVRGVVSRLDARAKLTSLIV